MEQSALNSFIDLSNRVDGTLATVTPAFMSLRRQEGDLVLFQGTERMGTLTPRAERNISRITRVNYGLVATLPEETLNQAIKFQLASKETIGILRDPNEMDKIASFVEDTANYLRYNEVLSDLKPTDLAYIRGNPVTDDKISLFRVVARHMPTDRKELLVGLHTSASSTANAPTKLSYGIFRLICSNGMIDRCFSEQTIKSNDIRLMRAVFANYFKTLSVYSTNLGNVIRKAEQVRPDKNRLDEYLSLTSFPQTLNHAFKDIISNTAGDAALREAGVETKDTLWDWANIMSSLAKQLPSQTLRESAEKRVFSWMNAFYKVLKD